MILFITGYYVPFTRLFQAAENLANNAGEEIIVQGHGGNFQFNKARHYDEINSLKKLMLGASVVVTQGAMSMVEAIELNCPLVVAPRQKKFNEHINDHQVEFSLWLQEIYNFPVVLEMKDLQKSISKAKTIVPKPFDTADRNQLESFLNMAVFNLIK